MAVPHFLVPFWIRNPLPTCHPEGLPIFNCEPLRSWGSTRSSPMYITISCPHPLQSHPKTSQEQLEMMLQLPLAYRKELVLTINIYTEKTGKKKKNDKLSWPKPKIKSICFQRSKSYQKQMNRTESNCLCGEKRSHLCGFKSRVSITIQPLLCMRLELIRNTLLSLIQYTNWKVSEELALKGGIVNQKKLLQASTGAFFWLMYLLVILAKKKKNAMYANEMCRAHRYRRNH